MYQGYHIERNLDIQKGVKMHLIYFKNSSPHFIEKQPENGIVSLDCILPQPYKFDHL